MNTVAAYEHYKDGIITFQSPKSLKYWFSPFIPLAQFNL